VKSAAKGSRPLGVSVLAALTGFSAVVLFLLLYSGLSHYMLINALLFLLALAAAAVAFGLWKGYTWAWWISIIFAALRVVIALIISAILSYYALIGVVINLIIVYYLLRKNVKSYFGIRI